MNSGKWVIVSFSVACSEKQGWASRKKARLDVFLTIPVQNESVAEVCSDEIVTGSVSHGDGKLSLLGMTLFMLRLL